MTNNRLPADFGFSSLGLLMQLFGGLFVCFSANILLQMVSFGKPDVIFLSLMGLSLIRSVVHFGAGLKLSQSLMDSRKAGLLYVKLATVHTIVILVFMVIKDAFLIENILGIAILLMGWPLAILYLMMRPAVKKKFRLAFEEASGLAPNGFGIEGMGVLMCVLGIGGFIFGSVMFYGLISIDMLPTGLISIVLILFAASICGVSALHTYVGIVALRKPDPQLVKGWVNYYFMLSFVPIVLLLLLPIIFIVESDIPKISPFFFVFFLIMGVAMAVWPTITRSFINSMALRHMYDSDSETTEWTGGPGAYGGDLLKSKDRGITALGYLLLYYSVVSMSYSIFKFTDDRDLASFLMVHKNSRLGADSIMILTIAMLVIAVWAAVELVLMTSRYRIAGISYAIVGIGLAILNLLENFKTVKALAPFMARANLLNLQMLQPLVGLAIELVLPVAVLILVNRRLSSATSGDELA